MKVDGQLGGQFDLLSKGFLTPQIYIDDLVESNLELQWEDEVEVVESVFSMEQNEPNPFIDQTSIDFHLPTSSTVTLRVYTPDGKTYFTTERTFEAGDHTFVLKGKDISTSGILLYEISGEGFSEVKKMIKID